MVCVNLANSYWMANTFNSIEGWNQSPVESGHLGLLKLYLRSVITINIAWQSRNSQASPFWLWPRNVKPQPDMLSFGYLQFSSDAHNVSESPLS